ncbi:Helicase IV [Bhargavaea cecembensis DSE10]|uniref:Helicase IV n=1 Tax=Bhargavaea cecembensis DSE10 TaxID=1235279 RepID=M7NWK4_9BACL|nr:RNA polymerase recycling motor HelD [Bhargavaea cecembensis]EMR06040.1 Helicase IV [Bhargavaea cecembensis DSE10]
MAAKDHPDYAEELERLEYTKEYMQRLLGETEREAAASRENIRQSMGDLEHLDSSLSYINILTNARFFEMAAGRKEELEAVLQNPYFSRIHFKKEGEGAELLYIGKTSLFHRETQEPVIVDWRSPVANVYYDGRIGEVTYEVNGEENRGHLYAKRQYKIEGGKLADIRDVDLTTNDELLQEALSGKADVRLTEIVSTIQKEQNEIIRANLKRPIIVQGAAGSGKTTIALHRISYFLYTMGGNFPADKLMILAPSELFIGYISDVLPELGVDKIRQTTFEQFVLGATGLKLKVADPNRKLEKLAEGSAVDGETLILSRLKGSLAYRNALDRYVAMIEKEIAGLFEDVYIEKFRIIKKERLRRLFLKEFSYLPLQKRLDRIAGILKTETARKRKEILSTLTARYEQALDKALFGIRDDRKRREQTTRLIDERDERLPAIEREGKKTAAAYMKRFPAYNIKQQYRRWFKDEELIRKTAAGWTEAERKAIVKSAAEERWETEDLAALLYLQARLKGIPDQWKMRSVFIDEAQDYSAFQLAALRDALDTDMFTIVGDLAQGIHSYRSVRDWETVRNLFPRAAFRTLQKSYRTTAEIMEAANKVLGGLAAGLPLVEPVVRHGPHPEVHQAGAFDPGAVHRLYRAIRSRGHHSVALITKTTREAEKMAEGLAGLDGQVMLLGQGSVPQSGRLLVVPGHLAKGLEFDAVMVAAFSDPFRDSELDRKLLYVAMTRPMHELHLIGDFSLFLGSCSDQENPDRMQ